MGETIIHMLIFIEDVNDILIKNLFITNGGYFPVGALDNGGGITCSGSNPIFVDVVISDNSGIFAGGINCWSSNPTFTNVRIINNTSVVSAGVIEIANSNSIMKNVSIIGNNASNWYIAAINSGNCNLDFINCTIVKILQPVISIRL